MLLRAHALPHEKSDFAFFSEHPLCGSLFQSGHNLTNFPSPIRRKKRQYVHRGRFPVRRCGILVSSLSQHFSRETCNTYLSLSPGIPLHSDGPCNARIVNQGGEAMKNDQEQAPETLLLTIPQAAQCLSLSRAKLYALIAQEGGPPVVRFGRSVRISAASLKSWLQQHEQQQREH
jgi:excisionase family DNA binding protein